MTSKITLVATLLTVLSTVQGQQSAASPAQIAYAVSQSYDQTGPGLNSDSQSSSPAPQIYSTNQQYYSQPQSSHSQQSLTQPQVHSHQYFTPPHYVPQQHLQAFGQPQIYSQQSYPTLQSLGRYQTSHSQPQYAFSNLGNSQAHYSTIHAQQLAYQPQVAAYSHAPQIAYSQVPQASYSSVTKVQPTIKTVQAAQPEAYDQYTYTYETQDSSDAKSQQQTENVAYEEPESNTKNAEYSQAELQNVYNAVAQRQKTYEPQAYVSQVSHVPQAAIKTYEPQTYVSQAAVKYEPQAYVAQTANKYEPQAYVAQTTNKYEPQAYVSQAVTKTYEPQAYLAQTATKTYEPQGYLAKQIYSAPVAKVAYPTVVKPVYTASLTKYATPLQHQQYAYSH